MAKPSSLVLILANLVPIAGVVWFDWSVLEILLLYWTESIIVGLLNVLRMASCRTANPLAGYFPSGDDRGATAALQMVGEMLPVRSMKVFMTGFFIVHYSAFCFGHISILTISFTNGGFDGGMLGTIPAESLWAFWVAVAAIFASHLYSYFANYLGRGENTRVGLATLMTRPYGRIMVMHVAVIFGAGLVTAVGNALPMLIVLVIGKVFIDLNLHNRERARFAELA